MKTAYGVEITLQPIADLANPLFIGGDFTVLTSRAYIAITG